LSTKYSKHSTMMGLLPGKPGAKKRSTPHVDANANPSSN
jgi:hypothetical protein